MSDKYFAPSFGDYGRALLLSKRPLAASQLGLAIPPETAHPMVGPRLSAAKGILAVGRILTHDWEQTLMLRNAGNEALEIRDVQVSCPCMTPSLDKQLLEPGSSAIL